MIWRRNLTWTHKVSGKGERAPDESADKFLASLIRNWDKYDGTGQVPVGSREWWKREWDELCKERFAIRRGKGFSHGNRRRGRLYWRLWKPRMLQKLLAQRMNNQRREEFHHRLPT